MPASIGTKITLLVSCAILASALKFVDVNADWSSVDRVLDTGVSVGAFPGCVAIAGNEHGIIYSVAKGHYTYGIPPPFNQHTNPPMALDTLFDMASCTKVTATTSAVAQFYQRGELPLETRIMDVLGKEYAVNGKENITVLNCMLHNSGYPPDPNPNYNDPKFGCPETSRDHPQENFSCQKQIYQSLLSQTLMNPIGAKYVYSDLSMITMMYVIGRLARNLGYVKQADVIPACIASGDDIDQGTDQCYYEAYVRKYVFEKLDLQHSRFLPPDTWWHQCAPCENDTTYTHKVIQGQVSDGNAYAMGGIAGHAGLFSNALDLSKLMHRLLFAAADDTFINSTTVQLFIKEYNHSQSSRAIGWNTNDPTVYDEGWNLTCGSMSPTTFMHLGYTGTQLCGDPQRGLFTVFLTNRVYPTDTNLKIQQFRQGFNTAVVNVFDKLMKNNNPLSTNTNNRQKPLGHHNTNNKVGGV